MPRFGLAMAVATLVLCAPAFGLQYKPSAEPQLEITITKLEDGKGIGVRLAFNGERDGQTMIRFTTWAGLDQLSNHVRDMEVRGVLDKLYVDEVGDGEWSVRHRRNEPLVVTYRLPPNDHQLFDTTRKFYRPIINHRLFHSSGNNFLALPQHLGDEIDLSLNWVGFDSWSTITSLGSLDSTFTTTTGTGELYNALYVAGPMQVEERWVNGNSVYISLHEDDWQFTAQELADHVTVITRVERDYFDDHDFPFYWVNAIAVGEPVENGYKFAGTRLHDSFALFLNPATRFEFDGDTGSPIMTLLAHEMMHVWIGGKLRPDPDSVEGTYTWFTEGFTDYFTHRVLLESGLVTETQYVNAINQIFSDYHFNPAREAANSSIPENFWSSMSHQRLPYQRGALVALALQQALLAKPLKSFVTDWLKDESWSEGFTFDEFYDTFEPELSESQFRALRAGIEDGGDIDWQLFSYGLCLDVKNTDVYPWDSGFDHEASFASRVIEGVRPGSSAHRAGLRNGQTLTSGSMTYGDIENPVYLVVDGDPDGIEYLPLGTPARMPQVSIRVANCL